jgi:large subunit ribosomal protein L11
MKVLYFIEIFLRSQMAETGPPLGTILGNLGLNTVKFCKEFNDFTSELPSYFLLKVKISVFEDKSFSFFIGLPSVGFILGLLKFERIVKISGKDFTEICIPLRSVVQLAKLKFPNMNLKISIPLICGSVNSSNFIIV